MAQANIKLEIAISKWLLVLIKLCLKFYILNGIKLNITETWVFRKGVSIKQVNKD